MPLKLGTDTCCPTASRPYHTILCIFFLLLYASYPQDISPPVPSLSHFLYSAFTLYYFSPLLLQRTFLTPNFKTSSFHHIFMIQFTIHRKEKFSVGNQPRCVCFILPLKPSLLVTSIETLRAQRQLRVLPS